MFDVGPGVKQRMTELNDIPVRDSTFHNSVDGKSRAEWGYGIRYDYRAVGELKANNQWEWQVFAYNLGILESVHVPSIVDMRGKLPVRAGSVYSKRDVSRISRFVVHHTAGPSSSTVQAIAAYQTGSGSHLPFPAIAYHFMIEIAGVVNRCHDYDTRVWGSDGGKVKPINVNDVSIHACYTGNDNPTTAQIKGLRAALVRSESELNRTLLVEGHRDNDFTECPGDSWPQWKGQIR